MLFKSFYGSFNCCNTESALSFLVSLKHTECVSSHKAFSKHIMKLFNTNYYLGPPLKVSTCVTTTINFWLCVHTLVSLHKYNKDKQALLQVKNSTQQLWVDLQVYNCSFPKLFFSIIAPLLLKRLGGHHRVQVYNLVHWFAGDPTGVPEVCVCIYIHFQGQGNKVLKEQNKSNLMIRFITKGNTNHVHNESSTMTCKPLKHPRELWKRTTPAHLLPFPLAQPNSEAFVVVLILLSEGYEQAMWDSPPQYSSMSVCCIAQTNERRCVIRPQIPQTSVGTAAVT